VSFLCETSPPVFVATAQWHIGGAMLPPVLRQRFPLAPAIGIYALGFLILAFPWLSGRVTIPWDAKSQFFPQLSFLARSLATGQSPFWTPDVWAGWPQIADPQSLIFSPLHFILALLSSTPSFRAADAVVFAHLFAGGLGLILLFRDRGWHMGGALVAALAFAFGGSNASRLQHIGQVESLSYLPLALFCLIRALERSSWRWGAAAGAVAGLIAVGRDQVALICLYLLLGLVLWYWLERDGRVARLRRSVKPLAAGAATGALIAIVPVVLTGLLAASSNRPEVGLEVSGHGSLHPADLLMLVFADLFGAADPKVPYWGAPSFPWHETFGTTGLFHAQNIGQLYIGALAIVAVLGFGILRGMLWASEFRFFTVALGVTLLYALGTYTPVFYVMYELLPGVALYRRPADATFVFGALLAISAGYLVHRWLMATLPPAARWQRIAEVALGAILVLIAFGLAVAVGVTRDALLPISIGILFAVCAVGVLRLAYRLAANNALAAAAVLAAFSTADLAWNNAPHESNALPPAVYDALRSDTANETVALLKSKLTATGDRRDRVELIGIGYHWPNLGLVHDFEHLFGHNPLRLADFARATNAADTVAVKEQRQFSPLLPSYRSTLENLFGVRFIATGVPIEEIDPNLQPGDLTEVARTQDAYVYENPRALPRVMLVSNWGISDVEALLRGGSWPDVDPRRTVLLASRPAGVTASLAGGTARIVSYRNTEIVVEADSPNGGLVVLNDVWHPWWRATVDGAPAEILKANVLFRAVVVPAGKHNVRFTFHPFAGAFAELWERISGRR
jgi:hypothetical protein